MKFLVKFSLLTLVLAGIILLLSPTSWFPLFYDVRYMGISSLVGAFAIYFLPKFLRVSAETKGAEQKNQAVDLLQFLLTCIILGNALGDLGLYQLYKFGIEFDKILHFLIPLSIVLFFPIFLQKRFGIQKSKALLLSICLTLFGGLIWEVFEYLCDALFQTHIYGVYGMNINTDTKVDLLFDILGSGIGLLAILCLGKPPYTKS